MHHRLLLILLVVVASGCATRPVSNEAAIPVTGDRIINSAYLQVIPNAGTVTIKRDSGFLGSACTTRVFIDAQPIADLKASEKITSYLPAGDYIISSMPVSPCDGALSEVHAEVKAGVEHNYRIGWGHGYFGLWPTAF